MDRIAPKIGERQARATTISETREIREDEDVKERVARFIASDESVDRYGDIIRAAGWDVTSFKRNPVLLFGHDAASVPIGKVTDIAVKGTQLLAEATFRPEGDSVLADDVWRAVTGGFLNAVSVGFMPTKMPNEIKDPSTNEWTGGFEFISQELLELSVVPVPANPQALALARGLGFSAEAQRRLFAIDERAIARVDAERRARVLTLARLSARHA